MATKAERARYAAERSKPGKVKQPPPPRRDVGVDTAKPGVSASDRKVGLESSARRNLKKNGAPRASVVLEDSLGQPTRKSTRRAANRAKPSSNLTRRQIRRSTSPKSRAQKAEARRRS
jgi:hypothetical protein